MASCVGSLLKEYETKKSDGLENIQTVLIRNISPHDSDSSETLPSYTQLSHNENLSRFFNSQSKMLSDKDYLCRILEESEMNHSLEETKYKETPSDKLRLRSAQNQDEGGFSGKGRPSNTTSTLPAGLSTHQVHSGQDKGVILQEGSGRGSTGTNAYKPPTLTEEQLSSHDKHMELQMLSNYKKERKTGHLRFLKDHKLKLSQNNELNQLGVVKVEKCGLKPTSTRTWLANRRSQDASSLSQPLTSTAPPPHSTGTRNFPIHMSFNHTNIMQHDMPSGMPGFRTTLVCRRSSPSMARQATCT